MKWIEWCFKPRFCTCKTILGRGQLGLMRLILLWIMQLVQDGSLDQETSSRRPARYLCTTDAQIWVKEISQNCLSLCLMMALCISWGILVNFPDVLDIWTHQEKCCCVNALCKWEERLELCYFFITIHQHYWEFCGILYDMMTILEMKWQLVNLSPVSRRAIFFSLFWTYRRCKWTQELIRHKYNTFASSCYLY